MRPLALPTLALALLLAAACADDEGLGGPAAPEELAGAVLLPVERDTWFEGYLLLSDSATDCNQLVEFVDEGDASEAWNGWLTGRHTLSLLRREPSLTWDGLYPGATSEILALDDMGANRLSSSLVFFDGELIPSDEGGYVLLETYGDSASEGQLDLGVVLGPFEAEACAPVDRTGV